LYRKQHTEQTHRRRPPPPQVTITLEELPRATRSLLLSISNFGGGGFRRVATLQARLLAPARGSAGGGKGGGGKEPPRVLLHCRLSSEEGADEGLTQAAMLKLYKELSDGAFAAWAAAGVADVRALEAEPGAKDLLKGILDARKQVGFGLGGRVVLFC
jgi:hypothetical protein